MNNIIKNRIKQKNGITLIALVITIIVLLILAGVSIAMLTGQNGILTQAQNAKTTTEDKGAEEKIKLAVMAARAQSERALDADKLVAEITNNYGGTATKTGTGFPVNATVDGKSFTIDGDGNVTSTGSGNGPTGGTLGTVTGNEEKNTTVQDSLGNQVVVPAGFEVVNPNDNVEDGIVVRDKTHTKTAGSEFVWIPVGDVKTKNKGTINIELKRYVFNEDGTVNEELTKTEPGDQLKTSSTSDSDYTEGLENSKTSNTHAKNIETFRTKTESSHGYYIGRYEARTANERSSSTTDDKLTQITMKPNDYVYNYITQPQAATLSRGMYAGTPFESDLVNSYAWDTAILFLQTFGNNSKYSQYRLCTGIRASQGTNKLEDTSEQDKICNVYDMASNCWEWSTETSSDSLNPSVQRGGYYDYYPYYYTSSHSILMTDRQQHQPFVPPNFILVELNADTEELDILEELF